MSNTTNINANTEQSEKQVAIQLGGEVFLRDYFAAKAMQARISQPLPANLKDVPREQISSMVSELAYEMADAMLKARG